MTRTAPTALALRRDGGARVLRSRVATGSAYAANTVFSADIVDGQVKTADLANGAVAVAKLADGSITGDKVKDGSIQGRDVLDNNLKGADIDESTLSNIGGGGPAGGDLTGTYPNPSIKPNAVTGGEIANGSLTGDDLSSSVPLPRAMAVFERVLCISDTNCPLEFNRGVTGLTRVNTGRYCLEAGSSEGTIIIQGTAAHNGEAGGRRGSGTGILPGSTCGSGLPHHDTTSDQSWADLRTPTAYRSGSRSIDLTGALTRPPAA